MENVPVLRRNFSDDQAGLKVTENYGVAKLENGKHCFLFIPQNFSENIDRNLYLIFENNDIKKMGRISKGGNDSIIDIIYNEFDNTIYLYE